MPSLKAKNPLINAKKSALKIWFSEIIGWCWGFCTVAVGFRWGLTRRVPTVGSGWWEVFDNRRCWRSHVGTLCFCVRGAVTSAYAVRVAFAFAMQHDIMAKAKVTPTQLCQCVAVTSAFALRIVTRRQKRWEQW